MKRLPIIIENHRKTGMKDIVISLPDVRKTY